MKVGKPQEEHFSKRGPMHHSPQLESVLFWEVGVEPGMPHF